MSMKKADLEKQKGKKIVGGAPGGVGDRFGKGSTVPMDKRAQREHDREMGLVPFAVKLHTDLVKRIHDLARSKGVGLNEIATELIEKGLKAK